MSRVTRNKRLHRCHAVGRMATDHTNSLFRLRIGHLPACSSGSYRQTRPDNSRITLSFGDGVGSSCYHRLRQHRRTLPCSRVWATARR